MRFHLAERSAEMNDYLSLAANCAASILMFAAFCGFVAFTVVLYSALRALRATRRALPQHFDAVRIHVEQASSATRQTTDDLIRPQIAVASTWAGVRAGTRSLFGKRRSAEPNSPD